MVNVIQFRNSFDTQGPGVPGVSPSEAVARLLNFQQQYSQYEAHRQTLDSVQLLFGIIPTPFLELDKTGEVFLFNLYFPFFDCLFFKTGQEESGIISNCIL